MSAAREAFERAGLKDAGTWEAFEAGWNAWEAFEAGWNASATTVVEELFPGIMDALDELVNVREGKKDD